MLFYNGGDVLTVLPVFPVFRSTVTSDYTLSTMVPRNRRYSKWYLIKGFPLEAFEP